MKRVEGQIVDIERREIYQGSVSIDNGVISAINSHPTSCRDYILPGFVDAHLHIESSMLTPSNFGEAVVSCGTLAVVNDPHEIANVLGVEGVEYMIRDAARSPIKNFYSAPSSVPATPFDISGGVVDSRDIEKMLSSGRFVALSEVMNVPGVLNGDSEVQSKLDAAHSCGVVIDGHAPMLSGDALKRYIAAGITTDHECSSMAEAEEKIALGMKILIREGSAARDYEQLKGLIATNPDSVMFCTDDSHPDEILSDGHIDKIVRRAIADGFDLFDVLRIASLNPIRHYSLDSRGDESLGDFTVGAKADFIVVEELAQFKVKRVYIDGEVRYDSAAECERVVHKVEIVNNFSHKPISLCDLRCAVSSEIDVIGVGRDEIITSHQSYSPSAPTSNLECDLQSDIAKIVYINRYQDSKPIIAYCSGFNLQQGAFATSVAHDSHNILAVGVSDSDIVAAVNSVISNRGALSVSHNSRLRTLALPVAGLMSDEGVEQVASIHHSLESEIKAMGCSLNAPFMTLSFLSLVVIPELKIGEGGLFSYSRFDWL